MHATVLGRRVARQATAGLTEVVFEPFECVPSHRESLITDHHDQGREWLVDAELSLYSAEVGADKITHTAGGGTHFLVKGDAAATGGTAARLEIFACSDTGECEDRIGWIDASTLGRSFVTIEQMIDELKTYSLRSI